ncbi:DNA methyltransferase [Candidatus Endomicrobiellum agilis]|uniref:DNA methyltransferase n=1 Tax=Candidatus Endomicrobiellum agilis TaxID=3238957 RepID=UPI0035839CA9|nr:type I restriction enzyme HsdR N-terminal domain-containing protein [Endomicrobium sp.]
MKEKLFSSSTLNKISNPDFKEDSVKEIIILPILERLGYKRENIIRSKSLKHPFLKVGSKKRSVKLIPDYVLKVKDNFVCVLEAKAPNQKVINSDNVEQAYSYAFHPEIKSIYFALCNGLEFSLFRTLSTDEPILYFKIEDIDENLEKLIALLSPSSFQNGKSFVYEVRETSVQFDYNNRTLLKEIKVEKQAAKRHFGVHGYFTKQSWNVVAEYIKNYSKSSDLVLDPFGGSGVTAIEALMNGRKAVSVDLNPMAVFLVKSLLAPVKQFELAQAFEEVKNEYIRKEPKTEEEIQKILKKYPGPKKLALPKGSDVDTVDKLFNKKQISQLALLKSLIKKQKNENIRSSLLLMFSGMVTRINLTYHASKTRGGGDCAAFRYYRYRIAPDPKNIDFIKFFDLRYQKVSEAKKEIEYFITDKTILNAQILKGTAADLSFLGNESVDYIYTDPPYGKKIPYLDLSVMWNAWLDLDVTEEDYEKEAIEGGEHHKSKNDYNSLIAQSIMEMYRVLRFDRWLSFVFAHKDPEFWHLIVNTAESCGFEYVGAVSQKNGQTSFKKRQNPFTVLSGQLIINFHKVKNPKTIMKANCGMNITDMITQTIEGIIAKNDGATLEQINDELIIKGLELGFLDLLKKEYSDITPFLLENFDYDKQTKIFSIKENAKFQTHIDVKLRIRYYLISYLRRMESENKAPTFNEIVFRILPLLKNGITPEEQTILNVLEDIGQRVGESNWKLKQDGQLSLGGF